MVSRAIRLVALVLSLITVVVYVQALMQDRLLVKALYSDTSNVENYNKILNGLPYYQHIEKAAVKLYNNQISSNQINCNEIETWGRKLVEINNRNTQGYYLLTACAEAKGNQQDAIKFIETAIKFDPLNSQYLLGAAVLYLNSGDLATAELYLDKVKSIDPNTFNLSNIIKILDERKMQLTSDSTMTNQK